MRGLQQALLLLTVVSGVAANYGYDDYGVQRNEVPGYGQVDDSNQHQYTAPVPVPQPAPARPAAVPVPVPVPVPTPPPGPLENVNHAIRNWVNRPHANTPRPPADFVTTAPSQRCKWVPSSNAGCKFPFFYNGQYYPEGECAGVGGEFGRKWCSLDYTDRGRRVNCQRVCGNNNIGKIIGGVVGGAAAAAGIGVGIAMIVKNVQNNTKKELHAKVAPPPAPAAPIITPTGVAIGVQSVPVAVPVGQPRLYGITEKVPPPSAGAASYFSAPLFGFLALLGLFILVAVVVTVRRSKQTARQTAVVAPQAQDTESATQQASYDDDEPLLFPPLYSESEAA